MYELIVKGLTGADGFNRQALARQIESNMESNELSLTIKNYRVGGLSQTVHEKLGAIFNVSGPLGRNLNVCTAGLNIAFAAGTGVLPFMDLVGFIAR